MPLCARNSNIKEINNLLQSSQSNSLSLILKNIKNIMIENKNARKWHFSSDKKKLNYNDIKNLLPPPDSVNQLSITVKEYISIYLYRLFSCLLLNFNDIFINSSNNNHYNIFLDYCVSFKEIFDPYKSQNPEILYQSYNYADRPQSSRSNSFSFSGRYKNNKINTQKISQIKNFWNIIMKKYIDDKSDDIPFQHTCYTYTIQPPIYELTGKPLNYKIKSISSDKYISKYRIKSPDFLHYKDPFQGMHYKYPFQGMHYEYPNVPKNDISIYQFDKNIKNETIIDITKITDTEGLYMNSHEYDALNKNQQQIYCNTIREIKIKQYNSSNNHKIRVVTYDTNKPSPSNGICTYENAIGLFYNFKINDPLLFHDYNKHGFIGPLNITKNTGIYMEEIDFAELSPTDQSKYIQAVYNATKNTQTS